MGDECCSCHISPPCSYCTRPMCTACEIGEVMEETMYWKDPLCENCHTIAGSPETDPALKKDK